MCLTGNRKEYTLERLSRPQRAYIPIPLWGVCGVGGNLLITCPEALRVGYLQVGDIPF